MASVLMLVGGAIVNALAFTGSNFLFSQLGKHSDEERQRHDKAIEQLETAKNEWNQKRAERLDWINKNYRREHDAAEQI